MSGCSNYLSYSGQGYLNNVPVSRNESAQTFKL